MARIAVAGWQHETNTFSPISTELQQFLQADNWPALTAGTDLLTTFAHCNIPVSGFIRRCQQLGHECVPLFWCSAVPSGSVSRNAYQQLLARLLQALAKLGPIDALYLDLHGAMVAEDIPDADGNTLATLRQSLGPEPMIAASLDLHANLTHRMVDHADLLEAYRTYPHLDMAATGARVADSMQVFFKTQQKPHKAFYQFNFLLPIIAQSTFTEPANSLYQKLEQLSAEPDVTLSFTMGFPLADTVDTGPSLVAYAPSQTLAQQRLQTMKQHVLAAKSHFKSRLYDAFEAVQQLNSRSKAETSGPVILADTQDNPGCGGSGDSTGILRELLDQAASHSIVACIYDPEVAAQAHQAGVGQTLSITLGEKSHTATAKPLQCSATVLQLSNGEVIASGPYYQGCTLNCGASARIAIANTEVIVTSRNIQAADQALLRHIGAEPNDYNAIVLKSSVHFRADFQKLSSAIMVVIAPGLNIADLGLLDYQQLQGKEIVS